MAQNKLIDSEKIEQQMRTQGKTRRRKGNNREFQDRQARTKIELRTQGVTKRRKENNREFQDRQARTEIHMGSASVRGAANVK